MHVRYKAIVIEHGDGLNKHLFYIWEMSKYPRMNSDRFDWHRSLFEAGVRGTLDECYDAIKEFNEFDAPAIRIDTIYS